MYSGLRRHPGVGRAATAGPGSGPTIEETGIIPRAGITTTPGSLNSLLGMLPGSSGVTFGTQPGRDDLLLGRIGTSAPRVPTAITMPGWHVPGSPGQSGASRRRSRFRRRGHCFTAHSSCPRHETEEGPPDGLTLDQAIDLLVRQNLDLRAKQLEIPQARADVLTAGLRANPIFYADSQLVPYGSDSVQRPGRPYAV